MIPDQPSGSRFVPIAEVRSIEALTIRARLVAVALWMFSGVAMFLACIGVYGAAACASTKVTARRTTAPGDEGGRTAAYAARVELTGCKWA